MMHLCGSRRPKRWLVETVTRSRITSPTNYMYTTKHVPEKNKKPDDLGEEDPGIQIKFQPKCYPSVVAHDICTMHPQVPYFSPVNGGHFYS